MSIRSCILGFVASLALTGAAFGQGIVIGDVVSAGGLLSPGAPTSSGTTVYSDGHVVTYKNYVGRSEVTTVAYLTTNQVNALVAAGAGLTEVALVRDETQPQCADAPYTKYLVLNSTGTLVPVRDSSNCVEGHRPDFLGWQEAEFLKALSTIAWYGSSY
jgi:hypothetical protein